MDRGSWWDAPVLRSIGAVVDSSAHVRTDLDGIERVASWMAYEEFAVPSVPILGAFDIGDDPDRIIDAGLFAGALNFAFTDFASGRKFEVDYLGHRWSDTEAMSARIHEALEVDRPSLRGEWLAGVSATDLSNLFHGSVEMPMLAERASILNEIGATLVDDYGGAFHPFVRDCAPALYADGDGLMERLITEFPRFRDVSSVDGNEVQFLKLAQLTTWLLHLALHSSGAFVVQDLHRMSAFADYILPMALRVMGVLEYSVELATAIDSGEEVRRDSREEIEIRAHTLFAMGHLTDAINRRRPADLQVIVPQVDYRLWKPYHASFVPHHLTRTVMY